MICSRASGGRKGGCRHAEHGGASGAPAAALEALGGLAGGLRIMKTCRDSYEQALELRRAGYGDPRASPGRSQPVVPAAVRVG